MALLDVHARAAAFFQECLRKPEGANAREYLKSRGLDSDTIARFRIGYASDSGFHLRDALRREFDEDLLRESGMFSWKENSKETITENRELRTENSDANSDRSQLAARGSQPAAIYSKFRNRVMFPICNDQGLSLIHICPPSDNPPQDSRPRLSSGRRPLEAIQEL